MARVTLTKTTIPGPYADDGTAITMTATNTTDDERIVLTGREIVICYNSGVTQRNITFTSTADPQGRTNDLTDTIEAGDIKVYGVGLNMIGWTSIDTGVNYLYCEADHADVRWGVLVLP